VKSTLEAPLAAMLHDVPAGAAAPCCPSCQAPVHGNFCSRCGEAVAAHAPSASEFIHEFVGHYVALEGKLWATLRLLVFRPGQPTVDFLRGRRVPYINPLRLYLTLSLVMFALIKLYGVDLPQIGFDDRTFMVSYSHSVPVAAKPDKPVTARIELKAYETNGDLYVLREAIRLLGSVNETWADNAKRFVNAVPEEKAEILNHGFLANLPYMLIGALPLFAVYLKLIQFRSGRRYGEHLVFALHVTAFAFLLASIMIVIPGNIIWLAAAIVDWRPALLSGWDWLQLLPVLWIAVYLPVAMHRVYGGSRWGSWAKSLALMTVHLLVIFGLILGAEIIAVLRHA